MAQKVFIVGATGNVGKELVSQMVLKGDTDPKRHANPTTIVGLASKNNGVLHDPNGIDGKIAIGFSRREANGWRYSGPLELLRLSSEPITFIDVTADKKQMTEFHLRVIDSSEHSIVTANKHPLTSCTYQQFGLLTRVYERYGYSCAVNAGAGSVRFLRNCPDLGDRVILIKGCFSGTLGYIATELENGRKFSEVVEQARRLGYTEPHPADDLDGGDVARKAKILARTAGLDVADSDIQVSALIPKAFLSERDPKRFMEKIAKLDDQFAFNVEDHKKIGKVLRYVATIHNVGPRPMICVAPEFVDQNSELGTIKGTANKVIIQTEIYDRGWCLGPVPGAGVEITARNIRDNLLDSLRGRKAVA